MLASRPQGLPNFERPPLDELVLSLQFADLPFKNYHAGLLWQKFADHYPKVEEQAPIAPVFETFGAPRAAAELQQIRLLSPDDTLRYWFISADNNQLLQVQRDRLIHNWRRKLPTDEYPRYEAVRERFEADINTAVDFFRAYQLGEIRCNQCEVSYINVIDAIDESDPNRELSTIFTFWSERYSDSSLSHIERGRFTISFLLEGEGGSEPVGRLHINAVPGIRTSDSAPVMRLHLTARGRPKDESVEAGLLWLDRGRAAVVTGFAAITTKRMHKLWGRRKAK